MYLFRFGPGLVIYWFGHIDEIADKPADGILVYDHFPDNFVSMNGLGP